METIAAQVGNKIFAIETNLTLLQKRIYLGTQHSQVQMAELVASMQRSIEALKELKNQIKN